MSIAGHVSRAMLSRTSTSGWRPKRRALDEIAAASALPTRSARTTAERGSRLRRLHNQQWYSNHHCQTRAGSRATNATRWRSRLRRKVQRFKVGLHTFGKSLTGYDISGMINRSSDFRSITEVAPVPDCCSPTRSHVSFGNCTANCQIPPAQLNGARRPNRTSCFTDLSYSTNPNPLTQLVPGSFGIFTSTTVP